MYKETMKIKRDTWKNLSTIIGAQREAYNERVDIMIIENSDIEEDAIKSFVVEDSKKNYDTWISFIEGKKCQR